jgi:hypothetical protein
MEKGLRGLGRKLAIAIPINHLAIYLLKERMKGFMIHFTFLPGNSSLQLI